MVYLDESWLDDETHLQRCDSTGSLRALATAGAQVREAITLAQEAGINALTSADRPRTVLIAALGSSALVADVLEMFAQPSSPVPVLARHDVPAPGWLGPLDLVIAVSLSGRAPGPLALAEAAARRGAMLITVGAEDSPLADVCAQARGIHVGVGRQRVTSRTSLWTLLTPVLMAADRLGLINVSDQDLFAAADALDREAEASRPSSESFVNPAKNAALSLAGRVPMALADGPLSAVVARRAAHMFARTARVPMISGELPDDATRIVATFDGPFTAGAGEGAHTRPDDIFADPFLDAPSQPGLGLLTLYSDAEGEGGALASVTMRVQEAAYAAGAKVVEVYPETDVDIARLASLVARVDFIATYLAIGQGLDPAISRHVTALRDGLAERGRR